jgi:hypothetical protein
MMVSFLTMLAGCTTFPEPSSERDSLVVVGFVLDFPDGFFDRGARTVTRNVEIVIENISTGKRSTERTLDGYVTFQADPDESYRLLSYSYEASVGSWTYNIRPRRMNLTFSPVPGTVTYLGDIRVTYAYQGVTERGHRGGRVRAQSRTYDYDIQVEWADRTDDVRPYLALVQPDSGWLAYPVDSSYADSLATQ